MQRKSESPSSLALEPLLRFAGSHGSSPLPLIDYSSAFLIHSLRRRFAQNQEDCTFTVLALLPTLGDQLFAKHNVEQLTESLRTQAAPSSQSLPAQDPQLDQYPNEQGPEDHPRAIPSEATVHQDSELSNKPSAPADPQSVPAEPPELAIDTPSQNLNPLAKTFVPGIAHTSSQPSTSDPVSQPGSSSQAAENGKTSAPTPSFDSSVAPSDVASHVDAQSEPNNEVGGVSNSAVDGNPGTAALVSPDNVAPSTATDAKEPSHLDAQEQRNKILADRQAKLRLWNDLKITVFTRTITSLYCVVLLTLQTHVQLNLIGRFAYLASIEALTQESDETAPTHATLPDTENRRSLDHDTERLYLTFSWWFLHEGWTRLSDRVASAIEKTFSPLSVKAQVSMTDFKALLSDTRYLVEHKPAENPADTADPTWKRSNFLDILFPISTEEEVDVLVGAGALGPNDAQLALVSNQKLRALLDETKDIIESGDFATILGLCIDRVFDVFLNSLSPSFGIQETGKLDSTTQIEPLSALDSRFQEITEEMQQGKRIRLASLFPLVTRQSQMAICGVPNEYIENLADSKELRAFSAVLYAAWSQL